MFELGVYKVTDYVGLYVTRIGS